MKLLYLDSMDLARLGDGKWPELLGALASTLTETGSVLVLSHAHLVEAVGIGVEGARARFVRLMDAGIAPQLFAQDPRDAELFYFFQMVTQETVPNLSMGFHSMTPIQLDLWLDESESNYAELRQVTTVGALGEFFGVQANPRSHNQRVRDTMAQIERALGTPGFEEQFDITLRELDLEGRFDEATHRRFAKSTWRRLGEVIDELRPQVAELVPAPETVLDTLNTMFADYGLDIEGADSDLTWGRLVELAMIRQRGRDCCDWEVPKAVVQFLVANRIPFELDAVRHLDSQRVAEAGDQLDGVHAMHLPFASVMTADKRTVSWLRSSKNDRIASHAARLFPGGNPKNLEAALEALRVAPDIGEHATS